MTAMCECPNNFAVERSVVGALTAFSGAALAKIVRDGNLAAVMSRRAAFL
jgi:hypothetical protein